MKKVIKIDYEMFHNLIATSSEALELLDAVHCYDTDVYENLKSAIDNLKSENMNSDKQTKD